MTLDSTTARPVSYEDEVGERPVADDEDEMQVLHAGSWHRTIGHDVAVTACGLPIRITSTPTRRHATENDGGTGRPHPSPLCSVCFTPFEIDRHRDELIERDRQDDERTERTRLNNIARAAEHDRKFNDWLRKGKK